VHDSASPTTSAASNVSGDTNTHQGAFYIAACEALGSQPEKPASGKLMLRIAPSVHAAALKAAAQSGTSPNKGAEQAIGSAARKAKPSGHARGGA
jgi:predicted HicB family RNase H-like nuclease